MGLFSFPATRRSTTLSLQALVSGRVEDSLTHAAPLAAFAVRLIDRDTAEDYPLAQRLMADGSFAFYASPEAAFPNFATRLYRLRVEASAPNYQTDFDDFDVGNVVGQPALTPFPTPAPGFSPILAHSFTGGGLPRSAILLSLSPNAVQLRGRVVRSDDAQQAIDGALIQLNPPGGASTVSQLDGTYQFAAPLPVQRTIPIRASRANFQIKDLVYELDYLSPVNELVISLVPV